MLSVGRLVGFFALQAALAGAQEFKVFTPRAIPIADLWGAQASPKNCFTVQPAYGTNKPGRSVSDFAKLQEIENISLEHRINSVKRCFPYNSETLSSFALLLSIDPRKVFDPDNPQSPTEVFIKTHQTPLLKVGFEYGDCKQEKIMGEISWLELQYTAENGIQKLSFADEARVWTFGYEVPGQLKQIERYDFTPTSKWIGIHGIESTNEGIESLGIITMDPTCIPESGELQIKQVEPEETGPNSDDPIVKPIDPVIEPVTPDGKVRPEVDNSWSLALIIFIIVMIVTIVLVITLTRLWVSRRRQQQVNKLAVSSGGSALVDEAEQVSQVINQQAITLENNIYYDGDYISEDQAAAREAYENQRLNSNRDSSGMNRNHAISDGDQQDVEVLPEQNNLQTGENYPEKDFNPGDDEEQCREAAAILDIMSKKQRKDANEGSELDSISQYRDDEQNRTAYLDETTQPAIIRLQEHMMQRRSTFGMSEQFDGDRNCNEMIYQSEGGDVPTNFKEGARTVRDSSEQNQSEQQFFQRSGKQNNRKSLPFKGEKVIPSHLAAMKLYKATLQSPKVNNRSIGSIGSVDSNAIVVNRKVISPLKAKQSPTAAAQEKVQVNIVMNSHREMVNMSHRSLIQKQNSRQQKDSVSSTKQHGLVGSPLAERTLDSRLNRRKTENVPALTQGDNLMQSFARENASEGRFQANSDAQDELERNSIYSRVAVSPKDGPGGHVNPRAIRNIVKTFDGSEIAALLNEVEQELVSRAEESGSNHNASVEKVRNLQEQLNQIDGPQKEYHVKTPLDQIDEGLTTSKTHRVPAKSTSPYKVKDSISARHAYQDQRFIHSNQKQSARQAVNLIDKKNMMRKRQSIGSSQPKRDGWWRQGGIAFYKPSNSASWKIQNGQNLTVNSDDPSRLYDSASGLPSDEQTSQNYEVLNKTSFLKINSPDDEKARKTRIKRKALHQAEDVQQLLTVVPRDKQKALKQMNYRSLSNSKPVIRDEILSRTQRELGIKMARESKLRRKQKQTGGSIVPLRDVRLKLQQEVEMGTNSNSMAEIFPGQTNELNGADSIINLREDKVEIVGSPKVYMNLFLQGRNIENRNNQSRSHQNSNEAPMQLQQNLEQP